MHPDTRQWSGPMAAYGRVAAALGANPTIALQGIPPDVLRGLGYTVAPDATVSQTAGASGASGAGAGAGAASGAAGASGRASATSGGTGVAPVSAAAAAAATIPLQLPTRLATTLLPFQEAGVRWIVGRGGRVLVGDEMGCGKTLTAMATAAHFAAEWPLLVLCPASLRLNWRAELLKYIPGLTDAHPRGDAAKNTLTVIDGGKGTVPRREKSKFAANVAAQAAAAAAAGAASSAARCSSAASAGSSATSNAAAFASKAASAAAAAAILPAKPELGPVDYGDSIAEAEAEAAEERQTAAKAAAAAASVAKGGDSGDDDDGEVIDLLDSDEEDAAVADPPAPAAAGAAAATKQRLAKSAPGAAAVVLSDSDSSRRSNSDSNSDAAGVARRAARGRAAGRGRGRGRGGKAAAAARLRSDDSSDDDSADDDELDELLQPSPLRGGGAGARKRQRTGRTAGESDDDEADSDPADDADDDDDDDEFAAAVAAKAKGKGKAGKLKDKDRGKGAKSGKAAMTAAAKAGKSAAASGPAGDAASKGKAKAVTAAAASKPAAKPIKHAASAALVAAAAREGVLPAGLTASSGIISIGGASSRSSSGGGAGLAAAALPVSPLDDPRRYSAGVVIISYETLSTVVAKGQLKPGMFAVVVADESHYLKSIDAKRTQAAMPLLQGASRTLLLTGTPALNRPRELYPQIVAVDPRVFPNYRFFQERYCAGSTRPWGYDDSGSSNLEELRLLLERRVMLRRLKSDILKDLPPKRRSAIRVDISPGVRKQMTSLKAEAARLDAEMKAAGQQGPTYEMLSMAKRGILAQMYNAMGVGKVSYDAAVRFAQAGARAVALVLCGSVASAGTIGSNSSLADPCIHHQLPLRAPAAARGG